MSEFYIGQKVVCVDDGPGPSVWDDNYHLRKGETYTICTLAPLRNRFHPEWNGKPGLNLAESPPRFHHFPRWSVLRFRPLEEQSQAIQLFRRIAADASKQRKITVREDV